MLRDFAVVCTHLQTITLANAMTTRKAIHMGTYEYGALLGNPSGHWSSAIIIIFTELYAILPVKADATVPN